MDWEPVHQDAFARLGIERLVDLFRLPREGLVRRFGQEFLETLDRATGELPDPRNAWVTPKRLKLTREMPGELIQMAHLTPYIEDMAAELVKELRRHDAGVDRIKILFKHFQQSPTTVTIGSAIPHRDESRWNALIQNKLANQVLPAPVLDVQLLTGRFLRYTAESQDLLGISQASRENLSQLVDMLRSRLGRTAVFGMTITPDARPEQAWRNTEPGDAVKGPQVSLPRPIHVLSAPIPLDTSAGRPRYEGASLTLVNGPECIEGGWWSDETWVRNYYQAVSTRGERLWVYRQQQRWFLHGKFS
jgi:protein ImuB